MVRVCSEIRNCLHVHVQQVQELKGFLINQGYNEDEVQEQIKRPPGPAAREVYAYYT